jgi:transposase
MTNDTTQTIGCDLGDKWSTVYVLESNGTGKRDRIRTTPDAVGQFFGRPPAHVVIEVGTHSRWVSNQLTQLGHRVTVANPRRVQLISQSNSKSDEADCELLARLGRVDAGLLAPVEHRGRQAHMDLAQLKARDVLVRARTKLVNHVRAVVKASGKRLPATTTEAFARKTQALLPTELSPALEPIYRTLEALDTQIKELDATIERTAQRYPDVDLLSKPNGVGTLTAMAFLLTVEDKTRFRNSRMAGAFFGLRPRRDQSGAMDKQLRITKAGDPFVRRLLVNCANYILGPFGQDCDLRRWGLELAKRGGKNARKRAKVALARKLAVVMHRLWVTGEVYKPLRAAIDPTLPTN